MAYKFSFYDKRHKLHTFKEKVFNIFRYGNIVYYDSFLFNLSGNKNPKLYRHAFYGIYGIYVFCQLCRFEFRIAHGKLILPVFLLAVSCSESLKLSEN